MWKKEPTHAQMSAQLGLESSTSLSTDAPSFLQFLKESVSAIFKDSKVLGNQFWRGVTAFVVLMATLAFTNGGDVEDKNPNKKLDENLKAPGAIYNVLSDEYAAMLFLAKEHLKGCPHPHKGAMPAMEMPETLSDVLNRIYEGHKEDPHNLPVNPPRGNVDDAKSQEVQMRSVMI